MTGNDPQLPLRVVAADPHTLQEDLDAAVRLQAAPPPGRESTGFWSPATATPNSPWISAPRCRTG